MNIHILFAGIICFISGLNIILPKVNQDNKWLLVAGGSLMGEGLTLAIISIIQ